MNLPTEIFGNVVVIHAPEELVQDHASVFQSYLTSQERNNVVLDLDNSEAIDSAGLSAILDAQDKLRDCDGDIKIATTNPANRKILEMTRLDEQLEVFDSVIDAVKSFR
jgi:anti-sigma B factor antagonist